MILLAMKLAAGLLADRLFGEPRRFHPLVGFGRWAGLIESALRRHLPIGRTTGVLAWILAVAPWVMIAVAIREVHPALRWLVDIGLLYFALGARSLIEHAEAIAHPLAANDIETARLRVAMIVSRDTATLDEPGVARAATESVLENGNDAVFGAVFWFCVLGGPGVLLYRLANTLDAMWGYRTPQYLHFGWATARIDDWLNWLPARLTALSYALLGNTRNALHCWRYQAPGWDSPNAGPVMASGAGALDVELGGAARYHGHEEQRPTLGCGRQPDAATIRSATRLVGRGVLLWVALIAGIAMLEFATTRGF